MRVQFPPESKCHRISGGFPDILFTVYTFKLESKLFVECSAQFKLYFYLERYHFRCHSSATNAEHHCLWRMAFHLGSTTPELSLEVPFSLSSSFSTERELTTGPCSSFAVSICKQMGANFCQSSASLSPQLPVLLILPP